MILIRQNMESILNKIQRRISIMLNAKENMRECIKKGGKPERL